MAYRGIRLDHIVIAGRTLDEASAWVEARLGVAMQPGGVHAFMGTHNRLLSLGGSEYLEAIAIDPAAKAPDHARWFGLDQFTGDPRPVAWVARADDFEAPPGTRIMDARRGDLAWRITIPDSGEAPGGGTFPLFIEWQGDRDAAAALPDHGLRLAALRLSHPEPVRLPTVDPRLSFLTGYTRLEAIIDTPDGPVSL